MDGRWETISRYKNMADKERLQIGQVKAREEQDVKDIEEKPRDTEEKETSRRKNKRD